MFVELTGGGIQASDHSSNRTPSIACGMKVDLNRKISGDPDFNRLLVAAGVVRTGGHR